MHGEGKPSEYGPWLRAHSPGRWLVRGRRRGSETGDDWYDATKSRQRLSVAEERTGWSNGASHRRVLGESFGFHGTTMKEDMQSNGHSHAGGYFPSGSKDINNDINKREQNVESELEHSRGSLGDGANGDILGDMASNVVVNDKINAGGPLQGGDFEKNRKRGFLLWTQKRVHVEARWGIRMKICHMGRRKIKIKWLRLLRCSKKG